MSVYTEATTKSVNVKNIIKHTQEKAIHLVLGSALSLDMYCFGVIDMVREDVVQI